MRVRVRRNWALAAAGFDPNEPRNDQGEWTRVGGDRKALESLSRVYSSGDFRTNHSAINADLRNGVPNARAKEIDAALGEMDEARTLYRVIRPKGTPYEGVKPGDEINELGFMSTTTHPDYFKPTGDRIIITIKAPAGTRASDISDLSLYKEEGEVLIGTGVTLRIDSVEGNRVTATIVRQKPLHDRLTAAGFDPNEPRDYHGRWTSDGISGPKGPKPLPGDAGTAVRVITDLGGRPLVVGGWVRDQQLGIDSKDIDIEVHGASPDDVRAALEQAGRVDTVGAAFGVMKFGHDVDVSFPRRDSKSGAGHKGFEIEFDPTMTLKEALSRRDFTVNSMAYDPNTGEIEDPFGGLADLKNKVLRATNSEAYGDDPLRVLRAVQFASRFDFSIDPGTAALSKGLADEFQTLSKERVWTEWQKILSKGKSLNAAAQALQVTGWAKHFPEFSEAGAQRADQLMRGKTPADRPATSLAATFANDPDQLKAFLKRIDAPIQLRQASTALARSAAQLLGTPGPDAAATARQLARRLGTTASLGDWLVVHPDRALQRAAEAQDVTHAPRPPLLTGDHLKGLGWTPGPRYGTVLKEALQQQDLHGWTTADEALTWLRRNHA